MFKSILPASSCTVVRISWFANDWVNGALDAETHGWGLGSIDGAPRALASIDRAKLVAPLVRCASEGVVSIVGDEATAKRALAEVWP